MSRRLLLATKLALTAGLVALALLVGGTTALLYWYSRDLPNIEEFQGRQTLQSTKIFDRTGKVLLYEFFNEEKRTVIPYEDMPQVMKDATVAVEDGAFWTHSGLDPRGIIRALIRDIATGSFEQGGSTITQQVIKNAFLKQERPIVRKIREAILAIELERNYSKEKILEIYLNLVPYGSNTYGIEAASRTFFGKNARNLTLAEAALLASLVQRPSYYSPYGTHQEEVKARQEYVLDRMVALGSITQEEAAKAKEETLHFQPPTNSMRAPHFVHWVRELLEDRYGVTNLESAGLTVITSLDWSLQEKAEQIVHNRALENEKRYQAKNAAAVMIDPRQGDILALVGSRDYFDETTDGNVNVALALRQPGSAFKPLAYAVALEKGYRPETILFDVETNFGIPPAPAYIPRNYDGRVRGPVTLRAALAQSLNIPSVKVLYLAGINETINLAESFGITTLKNRSQFGLSLVLGGGDVKLLELTRAYGVFAAEGIYTPSRPILRIENARGEPVEESRPQPRRVIDAEVARTITDILADNDARAPVFGKRSPLFIPTLPTAAKTGTTQKNRDAWTVGYTPSAVVGVWAGNNREGYMNRQGAGVMAAGPIWNELIQLVPHANPPSQFQKPQPTAPIAKPMVGGYLSGPHEILYYTDKDHPEDLARSGPSYNDPQFAAWEAGAARWFAAHATPAPAPSGLGATPSPSSSPPQDSAQGPSPTPQQAPP
ncbi:MAG: PBP1A family penicillin-binding protein [Patescibacteria group bacterium]|nr:PBP1A family penicillin-binding protein [Patescibacteria group bacterium]